MLACPCFNFWFFSYFANNQGPFQGLITAIKANLPWFDLSATRV